MSPLVDAAHLEQFDHTGATCVRGALALEWRALLSKRFDALCAQASDNSGYYGAQAQGQTLVQQNNWQLDPGIHEFIHRSPVADIARALLGSAQIRLYEDLLIYKSAGTDQATPWHQDDPQWPLTGRQMCSVWLCLEPVTLATGALRFVTGSSHGPAYEPYLPPERLADREPMPGGPLPNVDAEPDRFQVFGFNTEPGDVVVFHPRSLHSANGSAMDRPRRTFSFRFIGDDVRWKWRSNVFYEDLKTVPLNDGDVLELPRFPLLRDRASAGKGIAT